MFNYSQWPHVLALTCIAIIVSGCNLGSDNTPEPRPMSIQEDDYIYLYVEDREKDVRYQNRAIEIFTDNCQGAGDIQRTEDRTRTVTEQVEIRDYREFSNEVTASLNDILEVGIKTTISQELGLAQSTETSLSSTTNFTIPAGTSNLTVLRWREEWITGTVIVLTEDAQEVERYRFSAIDAVVLEVEDTQNLACDDN